MVEMEHWRGPSGGCAAGLHVHAFGGVPGRGDGVADRQTCRSPLSRHRVQVGECGRVASLPGLPTSADLLLHRLGPVLSDVFEVPSHKTFSGALVMAHDRGEQWPVLVG